MKLIITCVLAFSAILSVHAADADAEILSSNQEVNGDGSFAFDFKTSNGINREESGALKQLEGEEAGIASKGSYSYTAPDGSVITVNFVADENGFQATGDHLPTSPPVPEWINRLILANRKA